MLGLSAADMLVVESYYAVMLAIGLLLGLWLSWRFPGDDGGVHGIHDNDPSLAPSDAGGGDTA